MKSQDDIIRAIKPERLNDIAYFKLLMLNLHAAIASSVKLERIFRDVRQKFEGEYIYGKIYIANTVVDIIETIDSLCFCINSLTGGQDIDLYRKLDKLKEKLNRLLDKSEAEDDEFKADNKKIPNYVDLPALLREIWEFSAAVDIANKPLLSITIEDASTARELLIYCYNRIFAILDIWSAAIRKEAGENAGGEFPIIGIPISYLRPDGKPAFDIEMPLGNLQPDLYSNPGASKLIEGIKEVLESKVYSPFLDSTNTKTDFEGVIIYSNESLALYQKSNYFRSLVAANVCGAVGGNYINLIVVSKESAIRPEPRNDLVEKLLNWLDFDSFKGNGCITASIGNMTAIDTENQLNTLGKLLAFVTSTGISPADDKSIRENIEIFLENII